MNLWQRHFPPNGWGCQCRAVPVRGPGSGDRTTPPEWWNQIDPKTGAQLGIDRGFDYAPGASVATPLAQVVEQKLINLDAPIGAAMWEALQPALALEQRLAMMQLVDVAVASMRPAGNAALAHVAAPATVSDLAARGVPLASADIWLRDTELIHALRDAKGARGTALPAQTWRDLPALLKDATPYLDTQDTGLIYVFDAPGGLGKVAVRVNYTSKVQLGGKRDKLTSNFVRTGGVIEPADLAGGERYVRLEK